ncbi:Xaa-Pro peptidase family protein [Anaerovorax odorimutans]|uniref:Xaa-Pro peptidase family protein n=1 Tax=Anaerovorax odorimutans TaxID=109327 RepID=A0ABT1RPC1_9FIRM|nr:Xaa-Pro peptidase family protein [Anaerovorax odorimutans]MCQ4637037.1 Xaa-Pro peptidase family protein [Anaerovorax odorimutans]
MSKLIEPMKDLTLISEDMELPFPLYEYKNRLNKIRKKMEEKGIDTLYLTLPENVYYVSGLKLIWYRANSSPVWNDTKITGAAIHVNSDKFMIFDCVDEEGAVYGSTCCTDPRIKNDIPQNVMMGEERECPAAGEDFMDLVVKDLYNEGWLKGVVALEMGSYRPPRTVSEIFQAKLEAKGAKIVDGTDIVLDIRTIKSPLEINCIEKAAHIADIGHRAIRENLHEGMTELELVAEYTSAMMRAGGESMSLVDMCRFGTGKYWWVHSPAGRKKLIRNNPVAVDLCGVYNRYHADQVRAYSLGEPPKEIAESYAMAGKIMRQVAKIIKPNLSIDDFYDEITRFIKDEGAWDEQYWLGGYELGISFPPDWVGNFVYDPYIDSNGARFEPGMVVNFETGFGIVDTLVFTEKEARILGTTPWELQIVDPDSPLVE